MKQVVIAPVGSNIEALFVGLKEIQTERVILISPQDKLDVAEKTKKDLEQFKIPTQVVTIKGNIWEALFKKVAEIKKIEGDENIIINVATGDPNTRCAATSAAFVNGLKAFSVDHNEVMLLPALKFSYYKLLTQKKLQLLEFLNEKDCCSSLEELSKKATMSLPLVSYHIHGNRKSEGLKELGLVETKEVKGRVEVTITMLGRLLLKGYITQKEED